MSAILPHVRIDRASDPAARWIVLAHGLATDHRMWDAQIPALTRTRHVLRYDTRGHGASIVPRPPYGFADLVDDAIAVMDAHGIASAAFMGLSLGGMTGLGLALRRPGRLESLICACARADAPAPYKAFWESRLDAVAEGGMAAIAGPTVERWFGAEFVSRNPGVADAFAGTVRATSIDGFRGCVSALMALDYKPHLPRIAVPTFFVAGENDPAATPETMREMADAVPNARFAAIPHAGHIANVANPSAFDAALATFLG